MRLNFRDRKNVGPLLRLREDSCTKRYIENATDWIGQVCRKVPQKPVRDLIMTWRVMNIDMSQLGFYTMWLNN